MKAKKGLSNVKRVVISTMAAVCALSSVAAITAGAVEKVSTDDVYMMGYRLYGSLTLYPTSVQGFTYCERVNMNTGKSALTYYAYYDKSGGYHDKFSGDYNLKYTLKSSVSEEVKADNSSDFKKFAGALTESRVYYKDQPQYNWTSEGTDNELRMGSYINL